MFRNSIVINIWVAHRTSENERENKGITEMEIGVVDFPPSIPIETKPRYRQYSPNTTNTKPKSTIYIRICNVRTLFVILEETEHCSHPIHNIEFSRQKLQV